MPNFKDLPATRGVSQINIFNFIRVPSLSEHMCECVLCAHTCMCSRRQEVILWCYLFIYLFCMCAVYVCLCVHTMRHVLKSEDNFVESILSFHHVVPGIKFRPSALAASACTHRTIAPAWPQILLFGFHDLVFFALTWCSLIRLGWLTSELQGSAFFTPKCWDYKCAPRHLACFPGFWELDPVPHACVVSSLPIAPSPLLSSCFGKVT